MQDLRECNQQFRLAYVEARDAIQGTLGSAAQPVLVKLDSDVILHANGRRESVRVLSECYEGLKTLCHLPLMIALAARSGMTRTLSLETLQQYCTQARQSLQKAWVGELRDSNICLLDASCALLRAWQDTPATLPQRLVDYTTAIEPLLQRNIQAAAADELFSLHRAVESWRTTVLRDTWPRLLAVVCGSHQARYLEPAKRYFQKRFGESEHAGASNEQRVIYGEGIAEETAALRLLAGQLLDRELAVLFRGSPLALQQDVLGQAAEAMLQRLMGSSLTAF